MSRKDKSMLPISREKVEVEGVYRDEAGRETFLQRGEEFPADLVLGTTEWELVEFAKDPAAESVDDLDESGNTGRSRHDGQ